MAKGDDEYVQCDLKSLESGAFRTCWLNRHKDFNAGSVISLRGQTDKWTVLRKGKDRKPKSALNTDWNVGGLGKTRRGSGE